ncbi:hypothetical protein ANO11243_059750 [Dothideomycetidae sp. 11243]|nr:hypothetical protein ANO11243_059750 [fungal sp. No.11243]
MSAFKEEKIAQQPQAVDIESTRNVAVETIPGTEYMRNSEKLRFGSQHNPPELLFPHPTSDPLDPLNWSRIWKGIAIYNVSMCNFWFAVSSLSISPLFGLYIAEWNLTVPQVSLTVGLTILLLGAGSLIAVPMSNIYGRRVVMLLFGLGFIATCIWQALAKSYTSFLAARAFAGLFSAPCETLGVQVATDLFFLHERGIWVGVAILSTFLGTFIGPVIAGTMGERYGWPSFFWLCLAAFSFSYICLVVSFPETKYRRYAADSASNDLASLHSETLGHGKPKKANFKVIQPRDPRWKSHLVRDFIVPLRISSYPIVLWAGLCLTTGACITLVWNILQSFVFAAPPYNFTTAQVGYVNFAAAVGLIIGTLTAGPLSDWVAHKLTQRNGGVFEAEMRLPALIPYFIIITIGTVVAAVGLQREWPWAVIVILGFGAAGMMLSSVPTIAIAYAVDCYKPVSGEIMVVGTIIKNCTGFSFSYWVPELGEAKGFMVPVLVFYAFCILAFLLPIPIYFWGKRLRLMTADSPVHKLEEIL